MRTLALALVLVGVAGGQTLPSDDSQQQALEHQAAVEAAPTVSAEPPDTQPSNNEDSSEPTEEQSVSDQTQENGVTPDVPSQIEVQAVQPENAGGGERVEPPSTMAALGALVLWGFLGAIPGFIARSKGRSLLKWWIYGCVLFPGALLHSFFIKDPSSPQEGPRTAVPQPTVPLPMAPQPMQLMGEEGVRQRLRQFTHHAQCECVGCGYAGYMGLVKRTKPLHENGLFKLAAFMSSGPVRNWYAASAFMGGVAKNILECPNCGSNLEQEVGSRPTLMLFGGR